MKNYKNTEEQISRIKQLINEETLYGNLFDNNLITEGSGLKSIVDNIIDLYDIPLARIKNVKDALPDSIESTLKNLDSFKKINKVIGKDGFESLTDFKNYLGSEEFIGDIETFLNEVNTKLDDSITKGMKDGNPQYSSSIGHQKDWKKGVEGVISEIKGLQEKLKSGVVSVEEVKTPLLKNFDNFIKNYKKVAANYKNTKAFNSIVKHIFGSHKGDLKGLLTKIQTFYTDKVFNFKDWGNYKAYKSRYKEGWKNVRDAEGWGKLKEFVKTSYKVLPVGFYSKYLHVLIIKTIIMDLYCSMKEEYDPFQMEEGVTHNKKIIKEGEKGYTALDPVKDAILFAWDNFYGLLNVVLGIAGLPTTYMLDPMKLLGAGLSDMSCENFYIRTLKEFEAEIYSLIDSGESLKIKMDDGEIKDLSGEELQTELNKAVIKLKSASKDPLQLLKDVFGVGSDVISSFTLVGDNGEEIPMLDGKRINQKWLKKIKELRKEYD